MTKGYTARRDTSAGFVDLCNYFVFQLKDLQSFNIIKKKGGIAYGI